MRIAIDSNILLYAEGVDDQRRMVAARDVLGRIPRGDGVVPVQALGECFRVLTRKAGRSPAEASDAIRQLMRLYEPFGASTDAFAIAMEIASSHRFQIWDAVILATASEANCAILLSEDMQSGFRWRGATIVDPFAQPEHPLLTAALNPA